MVSRLKTLLNLFLDLDQHMMYSNMLYSWPLSQYSLWFYCFWL